MTPTLFLILKVVAATLAIAGAVTIHFLPRFNLYQFGQWTRSRAIGVPLCALALFWVLPHLMVFQFIAEMSAPLFYGSALLVLVAGAIFLDFLAARGFAGLLIMWVYTFANVSFALYEEVSIFLIMALAFHFLFAIYALCVAGKPYLLRDTFTFLAKPERISWRWGVSVFLFFFAVTLLLSGI